MKNGITIVVLSLSLWVAVPCGQAAEALKSDLLENLLVDKGFDRTYVREVLSDPRIYYDNDIIIKNLYQPKPRPKPTPAAETPAPVTEKTVPPPTPVLATPKKPSLYVEAKYIDLGREFITTQEEYLTGLEQQYGVPPAAVTAILIVESRLGKYYERYYVFNAYLNLAACLDPDFFAAAVAANRERYPELADSALMAVKKGQWALQELTELMQLAQAIDMDPCEIKGSYAGAIGPAQFIPSSFQRFGIDGDTDGVRDPFSLTDAMASIANYLKLAGWNEQAGEERQRQAIWHYNHSQAYVNTVMMLYEELSKG